MTRRPPAFVVALGVVAAGLLVLPLVALAQRAPWRDLGAILASGPVLDALWLSLATATAAAAVCVVLGVPLAWVLARMRGRGATVARALVALPMVLPPVVGGAALLFALGRRGVVGDWLADQFGIVLVFSPAAVVLAQAFVAMPFLVLSVEAALRSVDPRYEDAAATLGAGRWVTFVRVTLPMVLPSLATGAVLAWARALGEFGATITFAGNLRGRTQTMPLAVFLALEHDREAAIALSLLLIAVAFVVLVALRDRWLLTSGRH